MSSYDQWKTASPYDDEPDWLDEAEKFLKRPVNDDSEAFVHAMIEALLEMVDEKEKDLTSFIEEFDKENEDLRKYARNAVPLRPSNEWEKPDV